VAYRNSGGSGVGPELGRPLTGMLTQVPVIILVVGSLIP